MAQASAYAPDNFAYAQQQPFSEQHHAAPAGQQTQFGMAPNNRQTNGPFGYGKQGAGGNQFFGNRGLKRKGVGA